MKQPAQKPKAKRKDSNIFPSDRPIQCLADDLLQRAGFAKSIARSILNWRGEESLVISLNGGWGDGKSSIKGMVTDALQRSPESPYIVHFNPWEWAGQNQLAHVFFEEIGKQIAYQGKGKSKEKAQECSRRLTALGRCLNLTGSLATPIGFLAALLVPGAPLIAKAVGEALNLAGSFTEETSEIVKAYGESQSSDLQTLKANLNAAMTELARNVVVLIDDIDRLAAEEIKLLFQLIKANSDFPNLIFFLFFQTDTVEAAIEQTIKTGNGKDYLEKLVQVPLLLPQIQPKVLGNIVEAKLARVIKKTSLTGRFDWTRFRGIWNNGLSNYFNNLRDVVRVLGTYEFCIGIFPNHLEFDPVDLFTLETMRVFEEGVYCALSRARYLVSFSSFEELSYSDEEKNAQWHKTIEQIISTGNARDAKSAKVVIQALFPMELFGIGMSSRSDYIKLERAARVAHPSFFARYFQLTIPLGDIPQIAILKMVDVLYEQKAFKRQVSRFHSEGLALEALTRLLAYRDQFQSNEVARFIPLLADTVEPLLGFYQENWLDGLASVSTDLILIHLTSFSQEARFSALLAGFRSCKAIYILISVLNREIFRANEYRDSVRKPTKLRRERAILEEIQLEQLELACVDNIKTAVNNNSLSSHTKLREILTFWNRNQPAQEEPKTFFRGLTASKDGISILLEQFVGHKQNVDSHSSRDIELMIHEISQFMPVNDFSICLTHFESSFSTRTKELSELFGQLFGFYNRNKLNNDCQ